MLWAGLDGSGFVCVYDAREEKLAQLTPDEARAFARNLLVSADVVEGLTPQPVGREKPDHLWRRA